MTLSEYLKKNKMSGRAFAQLVGSTYTTINLIRIYHRTPTLELAIKIVTETDGDVSYFELLSPKKRDELREFIGMPKLYEKEGD